MGLRNASLGRACSLLLGGALTSSPDTEIPLGGAPADSKH